MKSLNHISYSHIIQVICIIRYFNIANVSTRNTARTQYISCLHEPMQNISYHYANMAQCFKTHMDSTKQISFHMLTKLALTLLRRAWAVNVWFRITRHAYASVMEITLAVTEETKFFIFEPHASMWKDFFRCLRFFTNFVAY